MEPGLTWMDIPSFTFEIYTTEGELIERRGMKCMLEMK